METPVYISGPMSGIKNNNKKAFIKAERYLMRTFRFKRESIVNPVRIAKAVKKVVKDPSYNHYMAHDLMHLQLCNSIYLLPGHCTSKGCDIEKKLAAKLGLKFYGSVEG